MKALFALALICGGVQWGSLARAEITPTPTPEPRVLRAGSAPSDAIHATAKKQFWKRKLNQLELIGDVAIHQPGGTLLADFAIIDQNLKTIDAKGNCVYLTDSSTLLGEEMHISMTAGTGIVMNGKVVNDQFTLTGERIYKLDAVRYRTQGSEYTTCHDCSRSWTIATEDMKMEIEGYAQMKDVVFKVKDAPVFWLPYLILPMKSKRQTGFLFPRFGASTYDGFVFVQPFFWAISKQTDMTIALGDYSARGRRLEWEFRYALALRSQGQFNAFYLNDKGKQPGRPHRAAFDVHLTQELPWKIDAKLRFTEVTDNLYPILVGDVPGRGELVIPSRLIFSRSGNAVSAYVDARRYRNLFNAGLYGFDRTTVQVMPELYATTNDQMIGRTGVAAGLSLGYTRFYRGNKLFDYETTGQFSGPLNPGVDPIRQADRTLISPTFATAYRVADRFMLRPSMQYRMFHYDFAGLVPNLTRGYLQTKLDFSFQIERIFNTLDPDIPRTKHLIRPILTYAFIPRWSIRDPQHPFLRQIEREDGYNFDNYDRIPYNNSQTQLNYFIPQGNSLTYGVTSQLIRRRGKMDSMNPAYQTAVELQSAQTVNINEYNLPTEQQRPFSRLFNILTTNFDKWSSSTTHYYYPYLPPGRRNSISTGQTYVFERAMHQGVLVFDRSVSAGYSFSRIGAETSTINTTLKWSLNDYILPAYMITYDLVGKKQLSSGGSLTFQSPSRCWLISLAYTQAIDRPGVMWSPQFSINLTGSGFYNVQQGAAPGQAGAAPSR